MLRWIKNIINSIHKLNSYPEVTVEMVYEVIPTTWIRKMSVRKSLIDKFPQLTNENLADATIYARLSILEVKGMIECSTKRVPNMHYDVGICRKTGPSRPSTLNEESPVVSSVQ